ncbi:MAG: histidine kinase N-terminal 7TM domain-containing protein [Kiritimatiellia bacterium]
MCSIAKGLDRESGVNSTVCSSRGRNVSSALTRCRLTLIHLLFVVGLLLLSLEAVFSGLGARSILPDEILFWEKLRLGTIALIPCVWLGFCVTYARSDYKRHLAAWGRLLVLTVVVPVAVLFVYHDDRLVRMPSSVPDGLDWVLPLGPAGKLVCITLLLGCVGMLVSLENTLQGAVGTVRWRIKFMVLGLAVVFGMRVYTTSHALLYSRLDTAQEWLNNAALIAGILLVAWSLRRGSLAGVDLYLSHRALYRSVSLFLIGIYLVAVGLVARQLEAFQTMSAFFVHDLKNVVTTLSLILGNMPNHFDNPAFREDVLKAVSKCVERMNSLIERLGKLREGMELKRLQTDLNAVVRNTLDELKIADNLRVVCELRPLP